MNIDLIKQINNLKEISDIKEVMAVIYADKLGISKEKALELVSVKFNKHTHIIAGKLEKGVTEEKLSTLKNKKDISIDEYLKEKPVVKG